jgi:hypothetical protein
VPDRARASGMNETPGEIACRAWTESHQVRHKCLITQWDEMREEDKDCWEVAAEAVIMRVDI